MRAPDARDRPARFDQRGGGRGHEPHLSRGAQPEYRRAPRRRTAARRPRSARRARAIRVARHPADTAPARSTGGNAARNPANPAPYSLRSPERDGVRAAYSYASPSKKSSPTSRAQTGCAFASALRAFACTLPRYSRRRARVRTAGPANGVTSAASTDRAVSAAANARSSASRDQARYVSIRARAASASASSTGSAGTPVSHSTSVGTAPKRASACS